MMWLQVTSLAEVWIEIALFNVSLFIFLVTSLAEVWIEIRRNWHSGWKKEVTSLAEVWIEILYLLTNQCSILSLPLRKCGLKYGFLCIQ